MIITKEWIHANKTKAGSWNRKQIEALGLTYPPKKGWQQRLVKWGTEINPHQKLAFESQAGTQSKGTKLDQQLKRLSDRIAELERLVLPPV